jgi:hypothetical protein
VTRNNFIVAQSGEAEMQTEVRRVEVKGTMGRAKSVEVSIGEVDNARDLAPVDLFVVHGISFERLPA